MVLLIIDKTSKGGIFMSKNKSKILKNKISNIPLKIKKVVAPAKVKKNNQNLE